MKAQANKNGGAGKDRERPVFGKGTSPLPEELKRRIEAQREQEKKGKASSQRPAPRQEPAEQEKEASLLPLLIATVLLMLLAAVMVLRVFVF